MTDSWATIIAAVLGAGGFFGWGRSVIRDARKKLAASSPEAKAERVLDRRAAVANESMLTLIKTRDELQQDIAIVRQERAEAERRHAHDRAEWLRERAQLRAEIEQLETRLRQMLDELVALKTRHGIHDQGATS